MATDVNGIKVDIKPGQAIYQRKLQQPQPKKNNDFPQIDRGEHNFLRDLIESKQPVEIQFLDGETMTGTISQINKFTYTLGVDRLVFKHAIKSLRRVPRVERVELSEGLKDEKSADN